MNGPNHERRATRAKQTKKTVTLFGNLGADPRLHQIPARTETRNVYPCWGVSA